jgi:cytochrome c556
MRAIRGVWLLAFLACAPPAALRYDEQVEATPPAAVHAVHAERLVELMRGLGRLVAERLPRAMDATRERQRRVAELAAVAAAAAESARRIPADAGEPGWGEAERGAFVAHARELEARASALAAEARELTPEQIDGRVAGLLGTCAGCHGRFRDAPAEAGR